MYLRGFYFFSPISPKQSRMNIYRDKGKYWIDMSLLSDLIKYNSSEFVQQWFGASCFFFGKKQKSEKAGLLFLLVLCFFLFFILFHLFNTITK